LKLPKKLKKIGSNAFMNLNAFVLPPASHQRITIDWNGNTSLTDIGKGAFAAIFFVDDTNITFPSSLTSLGKFSGSSGTGGGVFEGSKGIKSIEIPANVSYIAPNALGNIKKYNNGTDI
jgi:hypothetical protein